MTKNKLTIKDSVKLVLQTIQSLKAMDVLVGIPESTADRKQEADAAEPINNAAILYILNYGSPAKNIPARPVVEIGILQSEEAVAAEFEKMAKNVLSKPTAMTQYYERIGMIASNSIKGVITRNEGIVPPSPATLAARRRKGFKGNKALIVTGQLRNAITYVIRTKGSTPGVD